MFWLANAIHDYLLKVVLRKTLLSNQYFLLFKYLQVVYWVEIELISIQPLYFLLLWCLVYCYLIAILYLIYATFLMVIYDPFFRIKNIHIKNYLKSQDIIFAIMLVLIFSRRVSIVEKNEFQNRIFLFSNSLGAAILNNFDVKWLPFCY